MNIKIPFELRDLGEEYYQEHYSNSPIEVSRRNAKTKYEKTQWFLKKHEKLFITLLIVGAVLMLGGTIIWFVSYQVDMNRITPLVILLNIVRAMTIIGYVMFLRTFAVFIFSAIKMYIYAMIYNN